MDFIWSLPYLLVIAWFLPRIGLLKNSGLTPLAIRSFFLLKCLIGVGLIMLYTYYYPKGSSDIFNYFGDGNVMFEALKNNPADYFRMLTGIESDAPHLMHYYDKMHFWLKDFNYNLFNDNRTVIRFNALLTPFSFGNIYVHTFIMNVLAVIGLTGIFRFLREQLQFNKTASLIAIALPPSLLFWGSGLLKEGIVLFALGTMLFTIGKLTTNPKQIKQWFYLALIVTLFSLSKFYVMVALLPGLLSWLVAARHKRPYIHFGAVHIILLLVVFIAPLIPGLPDIPSIISRKQNDFINFAHSLNHVGSLIETEKMTPDFGNFMLHALRGFFTTLFRPHLLEVHNATSIPAAFENTITVALIGLALIYRKAINVKNLLLCISFIVILFSLSGMTTPVLGALVRYKIPAQPFLYVILIAATDWKRLSLPTGKCESFSKWKKRLELLVFKNA